MIKLNRLQIGAILALTMLIILAGCSSPNSTAQEAVKLDNLANLINSSAQPVTCNPNWNCTGWGSCECRPEWDCTEWSACKNDDTQTRTCVVKSNVSMRFRSCTDLNGCATDMPAIVEECQQASQNCDLSKSKPATKLTCAYASLLDRFDLKKSLDEIRGCDPL